MPRELPERYRREIGFGPASGETGLATTHASGSPRISLPNHRRPFRYLANSPVQTWAIKRDLAPQVGLEPTTLRLTAECSTIELLRSKVGRLLLFHYNI